MNRKLNKKRSFLVEFPSFEDLHKTYNPGNASINAPAFGLSESPSSSPSPSSFKYLVKDEMNPKYSTEALLELLQSLSLKSKWVPDGQQQQCCCCCQLFTLLTRKHHCRTCGRIICATCMKTISIGKSLVDFKLCLECHHDISVVAKIPSNSLLAVDSNE